MELGRDLTKTWAVVDMDMFFAAVEIRDAPHLADKPVAVGGMGMISTANYVARTYGVRRREGKGREGKGKRTFSMATWSSVCCSLVYSYGGKL